jgi:hypothetical protein
MQTPREIMNSHNLHYGKWRVAVRPVGTWVIAGYQQPAYRLSQLIIYFGGSGIPL